jgi:alpha-beta hydrolase superfamily lysophospholipase
VVDLVEALEAFHGLRKYRKSGSDPDFGSLQEKFAASYRAAGECQLEIFEGCEHLWVDKPGPMTDKAHEMVKSFIARYLGSLRRA